jgi:hypothetical protein
VLSERLDDDNSLCEKIANCFVGEGHNKIAFSFQLLGIQGNSLLGGRGRLFAE